MRRQQAGCFKCGNAGHFANNCPSHPDKCFNCQKFGHMSRDCPTQNGSNHNCYNCGKSGHVARDCQKSNEPEKKELTDIERQILEAEREKKGPLPPPAFKPPSHVNSPQGCFNCGKAGHFARECPNR